MQPRRHEVKDTKSTNLIKGFVFVCFVRSSCFVPFVVCL